MSLIYTVPSGASSGLRNSIYIGGRSDAKSLEKLQKWRISRILNVTPTKEASIQAGVANFFEKTHSFVYKRIPIYDSPTSVPELERQAQDIVTFITNGLFHGSVLVHCHKGVSRSTTCVLLYLMRKAELSLADAMKLVQRRRPEAQPIPAFVQFLERYEKQCQEGISTTRPSKRPRVGPTMGPSAPRPPPLPAAAASNDAPTNTFKESMIGPSILGPILPPTSSGTTTTSTTTVTTTCTSTATPLTAERTEGTSTPTDNENDANVDYRQEEDRPTNAVITDETNETTDIGPSPRPPIIPPTMESGHSNVTPPSM